MTFPPNSCIPTSLLTRQSYCDLICHMVSDGYKLMSKVDSSNLFDMWKYIGVTAYNELQLFDKPWSFMEINKWLDYRNIKEQDYPNILDKQFLDNYLGEMR